MDHPIIILVLARATNGIIGKEGKLPWHIPADLRHFKQVTKGRPMIMGRKTFESLPGMLEGRRHIVLTRDKNWQPEEDEVEIAHSPEAALKMATGGAGASHVCIIGGAEIYQLYLPIADRIELTEVDLAADGDTKMAAFPKKEWQETAREDHPEEGSRPAFSFVTLTRKDDSKS